MSSFHFKSYANNGNLQGLEEFKYISVLFNTSFYRCPFLPLSDIDECQNSAWYSCQEFSTCVNNEGNYTCACDPGYTLEEVDLCVGGYDVRCADISTQEIKIIISTADPNKSNRINTSLCNFNSHNAPGERGSSVGRARDSW